MKSEKFVRGQIDWATFGDAGHKEEIDYNKLGLTVPGGPVDYRLEITNTSNVSVTNLVVIDIFPFRAVTETGVVDPARRLSEWRPNLQGPITSTTGAPLTIFLQHHT